MTVGKDTVLLIPLLSNVARIRQPHRLTFVTVDYEPQLRIHID